MAEALDRNLREGTAKTKKRWKFFGKSKSKKERNKSVGGESADKQSICTDSGILYDSADKKSISSIKESIEPVQEVTIANVRNSKNTIIGSDNVQRIFAPNINLIMNGKDLLCTSCGSDVKHIKVEIHLKCDLFDDVQFQQLVVKEISTEGATSEALNTNDYNATLSDTYTGSIVLIFDVPIINANKLNTDLQNGHFAEWLEDALSKMNIDHKQLQLELSKVVFKEYTPMPGEQTHRPDNNYEAPSITTDRVAMAEHCVTFSQIPDTEAANLEPIITVSEVDKKGESTEDLADKQTAGHARNTSNDEDGSFCCGRAGLPFTGFGNRIRQKMNQVFNPFSPNRTDNARRFSASGVKVKDADTDSGICSAGTTVTSKESMQKSVPYTHTELSPDTFSHPSTAMAAGAGPARVGPSVEKSRFDVCPVGLYQESRDNEYAVIDKDGNDRVGSVEVYSFPSP